MKTKPTAKEIKLIKAVMADSIKLNNPEEATQFMHEIAQIAFNGWFAGGGAYFNFGYDVGSWLNVKLGEHIRRAEKISHSLFVRLLVEDGVNKSIEEWMWVADSYLMLSDVPSYKKTPLPKLPSCAPDKWKEAYNQVYLSWWPSANRGVKTPIIKEETFEERFEAARHGEVEQFVRYFHYHQDKVALTAKLLLPDYRHQIPEIVRHITKSKPCWVNWGKRLMKESHSMQENAE